MVLLLREAGEGDHAKHGGGGHCREVFEPARIPHYATTRHSWISWPGATSSNVTSTAAPTGAW